MDGWKEGVLEDFDSPMIPAPARVMIPQYPPMIGSSSQLSSPPLFSSPRRPLFIHLSLPPPSFLILLARRTPLYHPLHVQPSSDDVSFPRSFFAHPKVPATTSLSLSLSCINLPYLNDNLCSFFVILYTRERRCSILSLASLVDESRAK